MSSAMKDWIDELKNAEVGSDDHNRWLLMEYPWLKCSDDDYSSSQLSNSVSTVLSCGMPIGWQIAFGDRLCKEIDDELRRFDRETRKSYKVSQVKEKYGSLRWYDNAPTGTYSDKYEEVVYNTDTKSYNTNKEYPANDHYREYAGYNKETDETTYRMHKWVNKCKIEDIIDKYERISLHTCVLCGQEASYMSKGWISPFCTKCAKDYLQQYSSQLSPEASHLSNDELIGMFFTPINEYLL